jgi:alpha-D-ribose 1-methylphosphonate 5-triphosphate synthase subunit PhnG
MSASSTAEPAASERRDVLAILARASKRELLDAWNALEEKPAFTTLRPAQIGLVMARGRIGGGGSPFNLGEVAASRAVVRADSGEIGYGHVLGCDAERAVLVARFDALWQSERHRAFVENALIAPVGRRLADIDRVTRSKTAATRVDFFTLVRGEVA